VGHVDAFLSWPTRIIRSEIKQYRTRGQNIVIELAEDMLNPKALLKSLNDGVYAVDTDRKIIYWGPSAERITGWRSDDILGKRCSDGVLCHVDKDGRSLCGREHCPLHRAMMTNNSSDLPIIVFARHSNGRQVPMRVSVAPIRNASGKVVGGVETFRDVSQENEDAKLVRRIQSTMLQVNFRTFHRPLSGRSECLN